MRIPRLLACVVISASAVTLTFPVAADTVYLKNGRRIDSSSVRVDGERVIVRIYGGEVAFPMAVVDRIEENSAVEPTTRPAPAPTPETDAATQPGDAETGADPMAAETPAASGDPDAGADPAEEPPPTPPEQTREYWQGRLRPLQQELDRIDGELDSLRGNTGAGIEARIDRLQERRAGVQGQVDAITEEARRQGIPPGWLRIR